MASIINCKKYHNFTTAISRCLVKCDPNQQVTPLRVLNENDVTIVSKEVYRMYHNQNSCKLMKTSGDMEIESRHITAFVL